LVQTELHGGVNKVIVFYQHKDVGALIVERLSATQLLRAGGVAQYSGGMTQERRDQVIKQFTGDSKCRVLVAQIQAAGTGLNLQCAERVLIVEPAWTPALNEQAIARAYRAGQSKRVWASYLCLSDSIDERITYTLLRKQRIIEGTLG
jgi:SNF2 family DNA or RNA helicase